MRLLVALLLSLVLLAGTAFAEGFAFAGLSMRTTVQELKNRYPKSSMVGNYLYVSEVESHDHIYGNVKYDARTGAVSFQARLRLGPHSARDLTNLPSRDVYEFSGTLRDSSLRGTLRHTNALLPNQPGRSEAVVLKRSHRQSKAMREPSTFLQWESQAKTILDARGPKW